MSIINAFEGRDKAITDIKGEYLNSKIKDEVLVKFTRKEVDLFCEIDPSLAEFVVMKRGQKLLYVQLKKGIVRMCSIGASVVQIIFIHPKGNGF